MTQKKKTLDVSAIADDVEIFDGYHTFSELYEHREELFIAFCKILYCWREDKGALVWRSKKHHDGTMFDGYFIMGINPIAGRQMSYHLPMRLWKRTNFVRNTLDFAPKWDGHTPSDVLEWLRNNILVGKEIKSGEKLKYKVITIKKGKKDND